jgi:L-alanine-DL-glutamate epimerase-like enolase superfamily enzyme
MYDLDIVWLEEPLHWYDDVEPLKQVKANTRIPLASGERELTRWGAPQTDGDRRHRHHAV